jgi:hypothetical protein
VEVVEVVLLLQQQIQLIKQFQHQEEQVLQTVFQVVH